MNSRKYSKALCCILMLAGLALSVYLQIRHLYISQANNHTGQDFCSAVFGKGCDNALSSQVAYFLNLPLAAWGILFYSALIVLILTPFSFGRQLTDFSNFFLQLICLCGFITALVLLTFMIIHPALFCPVCSIIHTINILLFVLLPGAIHVPRVVFFRSFRKLFHPASLVKAAGTARIWQLTAIASLLFLLISGYWGLRILNFDASGNGSGFIDFRPILKDYLSQPVVQIPVLKNDPVIGDSTSKIQVVIFSDFFCNACKRFSIDLERVIDSAAGRYQVIFKNFPLDKSCNPSVSADIHPGACKPALASLAANNQGKFWPFHHALFQAGKTANEAALIKTAVDLGLNPDSFNTYRNSALAKEQLLNSIKTGIAAGVDRTPYVFVNGRQVKDLRPGILWQIIKHGVLKSPIVQH